MKELSIEEKARTYDMALEAMSDIIPDENGLVHIRPSDIFSELKESKNERVRKSIIHLVKKSQEQGGYALHKDEADKMLIWLEEQGNINETIDKEEFAQGVLRGAAINLITWIDYNAAEGNACLSNTECKDITDALVSGDWNKIYSYIRKKLEKQSYKSQGETALEAIKEEKVDNANYVSVNKSFNIGDWVVANACTRYRAKIKAFIGNGMVEFEDGTFETEENLINDYHIWTIQDAKDGDILWHSDSASNGIFIFKEIRHDGKVLCYCDYDSEDHFCTGEYHSCCWSCDKYIKPATKEQHDLLFSKMKEAGWEWDADKEELKKIEDEEYNGEDYGIDSLYHAQRILEKTLGKVDGYQTDDGILSHKCAITAIKKLCEQEPVWSENDEHHWMLRIVQHNKEQTSQKQ